MFFSLKDKFRRFRLASSLDAVLKTGPVLSDNKQDVAVLSLVQKKDLSMYLVALKSFIRNSAPVRVYCLNDGSLDEEAKNVIRKHVTDITFLEIENYRLEGLPKGGCWERLIAISTLVEHHYMIQLDCDTVTLGELHEVNRLSESNTSFFIPSGKDTRIISASEQSIASKKVLDSGEQHIQIQSEAALGALPNAGRIRYARASAGFSGFSKGSSFIDEMRAYSTTFGRLIGAEKWQNWGSEQFMSNVIVANRQSTTELLPYPQYAHCDYIDQAATRFIHFIGFCRYRDGLYSESATQAIRQLKSAF
jgi:hypothetical protein